MKKYEQIKPLYDSIFAGISGYSVSLLEKNSREEKEPIFKDVLYGELSFELFYAILVLPPVSEYLNNAKVFYDIGSGIGNAVIAAYLTDVFEKCVGVEIMRSLYDASKMAKKRLQSMCSDACDRVLFVNDNALNVDFSDADMALFCCPTKDEKLRYEMENKFKNLKNGSIIISLIHKFKNEMDFELLNAKLVKTAWGETPLFTYKRF